MGGREVRFSVSAGDIEETKKRRKKRREEEKMVVRGRKGKESFRLFKEGKNRSSKFERPNGPGFFSPPSSSSYADLQVFCESPLSLLPLHKLYIYLLPPFLITQTSTFFKLVRSLQLTRSSEKWKSVGGGGSRSTDLSSHGGGGGWVEMGTRM